MKNELLAPGNLIQVNGEIGIIRRIDDKKAFVEFKNRKCDVSRDVMEGVAINGELLEKLGTEKEKENKYKYRNFIMFFYQKQTTVYSSGDHIFTCEYLHQLQNLIDMWWSRVEIEL